MELEIHKTLVVSIIHLPQETVDAIRDESVFPAEIVAFQHGVYGYYILAGADMWKDGAFHSLRSDGKLSDKLKSILPFVGLAVKNGCEYVRFDCDGPVLDGYPTRDLS